MSIIDNKSKGCRKWIKDPVHLNEIEDAYHAGMTDILEELADRIEKAEIVNTKQVLEWIEEQTHQRTKNTSHGKGIRQVEERHGHNHRPRIQVAG